MMKQILFPLLICLAFAFLLSAELAVGDSVSKALSIRIDEVIKKAHARPLRSDVNTPWVVMHAVVAFENDLEVFNVESDGKLNAIDYLTHHAKFEGKLIYQDVKGVPTLKTRGKGDKSFLIQDHVDQFLFAYADAGVKLDREIVSRTGKKFTVQDKLNFAKKSFLEDQELGWTLVAVSSYVPFDEEWKADTGKKYRIEDVMRLAIQRDPRRETEGGPHHLYGVAYALRKYLDQGGKLVGVWKDAKKYLDKYVAITKDFQQKDGAFSAAVFFRSVRPRTPRQLISSTGHALEWMSVALTTEELMQEWVLKAIDRLVTDMEKFPTEVFSDGGLYHAAHALRRFREATDG
ncbi:MAG: hypothetical protein CMI26_06850 [Opitutae bacterium]|nr:hypothetical protein [Opitutae bacterium]|tara:strand:- start:1698 stop:2738 length:1041 start_codon:yes stop_codon:yes gene_type:complete